MPLNNFPIILDDYNLLNSKIVKVSTSYPDLLVIGLHELINYDHPKLKDLQHGIIEIWSYSGSFRIIKNDKIIYNSYDNEEFDEEIIQFLIGEQILSININNSLNDSSINISNNIRIDFLSISDTTYSWQISGPNKSIIISDKEIKIINNNDIGHLENNQLYDIYTASTSKRWNNNLNDNIHNKNNKCSDCVYFCKIYGKSYLWDYGACSNEKSIFDGKIVSVESTCDNYTKELSESLLGNYT
jgi:hypothetical protein